MKQFIIRNIAFTGVGMLIGGLIVKRMKDKKAEKDIQTWQEITKTLATIILVEKQENSNNILRNYRF